MHSPEGQALAAQFFASAYRAGPLAVADYATTHDPKFIINGGRSAWGLITIPNPDYGAGQGIECRIPNVLDKATPAGAKLTLTGFPKCFPTPGLMPPT